MREPYKCQSDVLIKGLCGDKARLVRDLGRATNNKGLSVAQVVKNLPAMQETWVRSIDAEDSLEKGMETHSSSLAWRIPWTEKLGGLQSMESQRVRYN